MRYSSGRILNKATEETQTSCKDSAANSTEGDLLAVTMVQAFSGKFGVCIRFLYSREIRIREFYSVVAQLELLFICYI